MHSREQLRGVLLLRTRPGAALGETSGSLGGGDSRERSPHLDAEVTRIVRLPRPRAAVASKRARLEAAGGVARSNRLEYGRDAVLRLFLIQTVKIEVQSGRELG